MSTNPNTVKSQHELTNEGGRKSDVLLKRSDDLTGHKFGRLTAISLDHIEPFKPLKNGGYIYFWNCKCECGKSKVVRSGNLIAGHTKSCGCLQNEHSKTFHKTHGLRNTRLYNVWAKMKDRCYNKNLPAYKLYGERGIKMCEEWEKSFESFYDWAMSNGYNDTAKKYECTIDRIDNNGNYCPENCRWVDTSIQQRNKRIQKNNNSGYKGIYFSKTENKYRAQIGFNKKQITIGRFDSIKQALEARNNYIKENKLTDYKIQEWRE